MKFNFKQYMFIINYLRGSNEPTRSPLIQPTTPLDFTVSAAESITAGALSNSLCSKSGASKYFKGGIVAYSSASKKEILHIDTDYAEKNNFANPFTSAEMARAVVKMFGSRIGMSTTGYSLPMKRAENKELGLCALNIEQPYAYICLYDSATNQEIIKKFEYKYDSLVSDDRQRAEVQAKVAIEGTKMYQEYVKKLRLSADTQLNTPPNSPAASSDSPATPPA